MPEIQRRLITYCTNIHPGEAWREIVANLRQHLPTIKQAVSPSAPFPVGLRLSNRSALEPTNAEVERFTHWLTAAGCFVPTLNGFPFGSFHGARIKQRVYLPDWRSSERAEYTKRLAALLCGWLPAGTTGSLSSVPLGFKGAVGEADLPQVMEQLRNTLSYLRQLYLEQGKKVLLALEPEPGCLLETTDEVCNFFEWLDLPANLRDHLGICFDCCHQAVQFEDPSESLAKLAAADIPVAKVQVSSALRFLEPEPDTLTRFAEPCYLHQVVVRSAGGMLSRYDDLPEAMERHRREKGDEWRCHFHLPIFCDGTGHYGTTRFYLEEILPLLPADVLLEVETYTWDVLPEELQCGSVTESIIRELNWLKGCLDAAHRCA